MRTIRPWWCVVPALAALTLVASLATLSIAQPACTPTRPDSEGRFRYETDLPVRYFGRPPHLHAQVTAPGHRPLITQLYPTPGQTSLTFNFVLASD